MLNDGDVGSWLWQVWDLYLLHGTPEAQRFQEVEAALGGSHLVWFWWWKAHNPDTRWVEFVTAMHQRFPLEPKTYYGEKNDDGPV